MATAQIPAPIPAFAVRESSLLGPAVLDDIGLGVAVGLVVLFGSIILYREITSSVTIYVEMVW